MSQRKGEVKILCGQIFGKWLLFGNFHAVFGPPSGGPILFLLSPEVSRMSGTMSIYIYIYVNNMADAKSVQNLPVIFR